jgi:predicted PurR-regulated permease PerM
MSSATTSPKLDVQRFRVAQGIAPQTLQRKTAVIVATSAAMAAIVLALWTARAALLILFAGIIFAILLRTASRWIQRQTKLSAGCSLALFLFCITALATLGVWLRGSEIGSQIDQLQQKLPPATRQLIAVLPNFAVGRWLIRHGADPQQLPRLMDLIPRVTGFLSSTLGLILGLLLVIYVGISVAAEPETYRKGVERLFTPNSRLRVSHVVDEIEQTLRRWLIARAVSMCGIGLLVTIGLYVLHVPLAGTLGIFAATMTFIPNLGPILSVIPPALLAFTNSPKQALLVLILFGAIHIIEGWFLTPIAERTVVRLPPALTLSVQLLLAVVAGGIGVALAAPLTVLAVVLTRTLYVERIENVSG